MSVVFVRMTEKMTTAEAAKHFKVSERTIRRWVNVGKLNAEWTNGQWAIQVSECPSEGPVDRESVLSSDRLTESLEFEVSRLQKELSDRDRQLEQADLKKQHLKESVEEKNVEVQCLHKLLDQRNQTIDELTRALSQSQQLIDHAQQLAALAQKQSAALTERVEALEDLRSRPWWKRWFSS